jgi:signal transduction histidine kinase
LNLQTDSSKKKISEEDRSLLEEWARHAAIAIQNADTFRSLQTLVLELEQKAKGAAQESEALRERLIRKEKLAALGQIVGSVNHELRQPLEVITNAVYYLKALLERNEIGTIKKDFERFLNIISEECVNTTDLVNELLHFTRKKDVVPLGVDLNELLESILLKINIPNKIKVKRGLAPNLPLICADPVQLSRAFHNILINAIQAMPKGGVLRVSTEASGEWVKLMIRDSGVGISPEHIKKIFEPLFTTKTKGIGLGLSLVKEYIEGNQGQIEVQSEGGVGTTFQISFPSLAGRYPERQ